MRREPRGLGGREAPAPAPAPAPRPAPPWAARVVGSPSPRSLRLAPGLRLRGFGPALRPRARALPGLPRVGPSCVREHRLSTRWDWATHSRKRENQIKLVLVDKVGFERVDELIHCSVTLCSALCWYHYKGTRVLEKPKIARGKKKCNDFTIWAWSRMPFLPLFHCAVPYVLLRV